jgi:hypothetical protein
MLSVSRSSVHGDVHLRYELDEFMGGQVGTEVWADTFSDKIMERNLPEVRSLADASLEIQRLVCGQVVEQTRPKM